MKNKVLLIQRIDCASDLQMFYRDDVTDEELARLRTLHMRFNSAESAVEEWYTAEWLETWDWACETQNWNACTPQCGVPYPKGADGLSFPTTFVDLTSPLNIIVTGCKLDRKQVFHDHRTKPISN
jgi:hypothetical protein